MTKKEFEKETYLAPEWGLRVVRVERHFLLEDSDFSNSNVEIPGEGDGGDLDGDDN